MNWFKIAQYDFDQIQRLSKENPYPFSQWFGKDGREYVPFFSGEDYQKQEGVDKYVRYELEENGYQITDYQKGYCSKDNRIYRIAKVLNMLKQKKNKEIQQRIQITQQNQDPIKKQIFINQLQEEEQELNKYYDEIINTFINSPYRKNQAKKTDSGYYVVISQNPHDLAQMSTGRQWTSCMDLGGEGRGPGSHHQDVFCEVQQGGLVAYLIRSDDKEIENPLARIHIRRFTNRKGQSYAIPEESVYGNEISGFQQFVKSWLSQKQGDAIPGVYERKGGEYSDTFNKNILVSPSNIDDIIKWLRGEGEDAQHSTWSVNDHLFLKFNEINDWGGEYNDEPPINDETRTFDTREEAEEYLDKKIKEDNEYGEYDREEIANHNSNSKWTIRDEESGEWEEGRFYLRENKKDNRSNMKNEAIKQILKAPKGTYPKEIIQEVKEMLFGGNIIHSPHKSKLITSYPELFTDKEIVEMKDEDKLKMFKNLPPERQEQQRQEWGEYINDTLDNPQVFINSDVQKVMRERDRLRGRDAYRAEDSVGLYYMVALDNWLFRPLQEIFKPIPEPIIQKLVNFGKNFMKEENPIAPYENLPKYDQEILSDMVLTFSRTKSDTPTVQRFYKEMLSLWTDNRKTYCDGFSILNINTLGRAIGDLGENGREFLPFIENKISEEIEFLNKLEDKGHDPDKDLLKGVYKKIEKLYNIKDSIESGTGKSQTYKWTNKKMNWYKKAQYNIDNINIEHLGSCMVVAEEITKQFLSKGIIDFQVVEGWVDFVSCCFEDEDLITHTWIEYNDIVIDPSKIQFKKWGYDPEEIVYAKVKKRYSPEEYLKLCQKYPGDFQFFKPKIQ